MKQTKPVSLAKIELQPAHVENPDWRPDLDGERAFPRKVAAMVNVRESAISLLASKRDLQGRPLLDAGQVKAADNFRKLWEAMGGTGAGAIDYGKTRVDGGQIAEPITMRQLEAGLELKAIEKALTRKYGSYAYWLITAICGEGKSIHDMTANRRERATMTDNLRMYLDLMAEEDGLATRRGKQEAR